MFVGVWSGLRSAFSRRWTTPSLLFFSLPLSSFFFFSLLSFANPTRTLGAHPSPPSPPSLRVVAPRAAASVALPRRFSPSRALPTCPCSFSGAPAAPPLRRFYLTLLSTLPILLVLHPLLLRTTLLSTFAAFSLNPCRPGFFHDARCRRPVTRACFSRSTTAQDHATPLRARALCLE